MGVRVSEAAGTGAQNCQYRNNRMDELSDSWDL